MLMAITREISPAITNCVLTHLDREPIDLAKARVQHRQYEAALAAAGCRVHTLPAEPDLPDSVFVEDAAVVLDELAVITRPGVASRRLETDSIAEALRPHRQLAYIQSPGTIDGGDVLQVGKQLFIGLSGRTNRQAVEQMHRLLSPLGYKVHGVAVQGCLHLKSAVTRVAENTLLMNRAWVDLSAFGQMDIIDVHPSEPHGANALLLGERVIYSDSYPSTRDRLLDWSILLETVPMSELAKAEGAVTCCSLVFGV
jgi:dimethylargininase